MQAGRRARSRAPQPVSAMARNSLSSAAPDSSWSPSPRRRSLNRALTLLAPCLAHDVDPQIAPFARDLERPAPRAHARARLLLRPAVPLDFLDPVGLAARGGGEPVRDRAFELRGARLHPQVRLGAV